MKMIFAVAVLLLLVGGAGAAVYTYYHRPFTFAGDKLGESLADFKGRNDLVQCDNVLTKRELDQQKRQMDTEHTKRELQNDEMKLDNDHLEEQIANLEGRHPNYAQTSKDEALVRADHLSLELQKDAAMFDPPQARPLDEKGYIECSSGSSKALGSVKVYATYYFYHGKLAGIALNPPFEKSKKLVTAAESVFGPGGVKKDEVVVWQRANQAASLFLAGSVTLRDMKGQPPEDWGQN